MDFSIFIFDNGLCQASSPLDSCFSSIIFKSPKAYNSVSDSDPTILLHSHCLQVLFKSIPLNIFNNLPFLNCYFTSYFDFQVYTSLKKTISITIMAKSNPKLRSSTTQKQSESQTQPTTSSTRPASSRQRTTQAVNLDSDEEIEEQNDQNFQTEDEGEGSADDQEKSNEDSFDSNVSPADGKRNRKAVKKSGKKKKPVVSKRNKVSSTYIPITLMMFDC